MAITMKEGQVDSVGWLEDYDDDDDDLLEISLECEEEDRQEQEGPGMSRSEARRYRGIVARLNYLSPDRIDIQFAVKECARNMATPREGHWAALTRIGRYLR